MANDTPDKVLVPSTLVTAHVNEKPLASATGLTRVEAPIIKTAQNPTRKNFTGSSLWLFLMTTNALWGMAAVRIGRFGELFLAEVSWMHPEPAEGGGSMAQMVCGSLKRS